MELDHFKLSSYVKLGKVNQNYIISILGDNRKWLQKNGFESCQKRNEYVGEHYNMGHS